jgi:photosystem II stability/assembly factor-like uncharacterized protein
MKRCRVGLLVFLLLLFFTFQSVPAQTDWQWQYPKPQGNSLYAVDHYGGAAVAVGEFCTVIINTVGTSGWSVIPKAAGLRETLRGVCMIDPLTATAVGENGTIIRTDAAGVSWTVQSSGTSETLYDVTFTSLTTGYAVGGSGTLLKTTDGGVNWVPLPSGTTEMLKGVSFSHPDTGAVVGSGGTILRTTDAGATWVAQTSGTTATLNAIQLITGSTGYTVGGSSLLKTTDGGTTWNVTGSWGANLVDLSFFDTGNGGVIGNYGGDGPTVFIWMETIDLPDSEDEEIYWQVVEEPGPMWGVSATGPSSGLAVGFWGMMRATGNAGHSWRAAGGPPPDYFPYFMGGLDLWGTYNAVAVVYYGGGGWPISKVLRTTDGGVTWHISSVSSGAGVSLYNVAYADENVVYAVGSGNMTWDYGGVILRSTNGGVSWEEYYSYFCQPGGSNCVYSFFDIDFGDPDHGIAIGSGGAILKIGGGGMNKVETATGVSLGAVSMPNATTVFGLGGGTIYRSTDGGSNWIPQLTVSESLHGVHFTDADHGTVVGSNGTILRTWNGGENWYPTTTGTADEFFKVSFSSPLVGFVLSRSGTLFKTTDGGATWTSEPSPVGNARSLHTINQFNVVIAGDYWSIVAKRDESTVPVDYAALAAAVIDNAVRLEWSTGGDGSIQGFNVYRRGMATDKYARLNHRLIPEQTRTFSDHTVRPGYEYEFVIGVVYDDGSEVLSNTAVVELPVVALELRQNYPNPFNPSTSIEFMLPETQRVKVKVYDVSGRHVVTLVDGIKPRGLQTVEWDARNSSGQPVSSGIYYYRLQAGKHNIARRMVLIR